MITIFDILDNFFTTENAAKQALNLPGTQILKLGQEARKFAANFTVPKIGDYGSPLYIGGWPSANIWNLHISAPAFTSMLYCGQVLAKDPISDWFSIEQYKFPKRISARTGIVSTLNDPKWNIDETRFFLHNILPKIYQLRPLVEAGVLVLAPSFAIRAKHHLDIEKTAKDYIEKVCPDPGSFTKIFSPLDLPIDDNMRGMFLFAGGDPEKQIQDFVGQSIYYLLSEFLFAAEMGFEFVAPNPFEEYFCRTVIEDKIRNKPSPVIEGLLTSSYPLYSGLTPEKIISIRNDEAFGEFRKELFTMYAQIGNINDPSDIKNYLRDAENTYLAPILKKIKYEISKGSFGRLGISFLSSTLRIGGTIATCLLTKDLTHIVAGAIASEALGKAADQLETYTSDKNLKTFSIWKKLYVNGASPYEHMIQSKHIPNQGTVGSQLWGLPERLDGTKLIITQGRMLEAFLTPCADKEKFTGSEINPYGFCPCRSTLKYKFCCRNLGSVTF